MYGVVCVYVWGCVCICMYVYVCMLYSVCHNFTLHLYTVCIHLYIPIY